MFSLYKLFITFIAATFPNIASGQGDEETAMVWSSDSASAGQGSTDVRGISLSRLMKQALAIEKRDKTQNRLRVLSALEKNRKVERPQVIRARYPSTPLTRLINLAGQYTVSRIPDPRAVLPAAVDGWFLRLPRPDSKGNYPRPSPAALERPPSPMPVPPAVTVQTPRPSAVRRLRFGVPVSPAGNGSPPTSIALSPAPKVYSGKNVVVGKVLNYKLQKFIRRHCVLVSDTPSACQIGMLTRGDLKVKEWFDKKIARIW